MMGFEHHHKHVWAAFLYLCIVLKLLPVLCWQALGAKPRGQLDPPNKKVFVKHLAVVCVIVPPLLFVCMHANHHTGACCGLSV